MPFIGTQPEVGGYSVLDALTASATASYTLQLNSANFIPDTANQLLVSLNGVIQKPGSSFTVSGSNVSFGVVTGTELRSSGDVIAYYSSDFTLKENINPIANALDKVSQLGGYNFDWKDTHLETRGGLDDMFVKKSDVGIIAQEVQKVLPEAVGKREDGTLGVRYELLVPLLVESIKELSEKVKELGGE